MLILIVQNNEREKMKKSTLPIFQVQSKLLAKFRQMKYFMVGFSPVDKKR